MSLNVDALHKKNLNPVEKSAKIYKIFSSININGDESNIRMDINLFIFNHSNHSSNVQTHLYHDTFSSIFQRRPIATRTRQFRRMDFNEWASNVINKGTLRSSNHFSYRSTLIPTQLSLIIFISVLNTQSAYRPMPSSGCNGTAKPLDRSRTILLFSFLLFLSTLREHF